MLRRLGPAALVAVAALTLGGGSAGAARTVPVSLKDISFTPAKVTIKRGDRVRWTWRDERTLHNVTSTGAKRFKSSQTKNKGYVYTVRFTKAGTYRYLCNIHPGMTGRVVVK